MSLSSRQPRRTLGFEQLETKVSPTTSFVDFHWTAEQDTAWPVDQARQQTSLLLQYVADTVNTISIQRPIPSAVEARAADQMLTAEPAPLE